MMIRVRDVIEVMVLAITVYAMCVLFGGMT
jgi:hypothetical protein